MLALIPVALLSNKEGCKMTSEFQLQLIQKVVQNYPRIPLSTNAGLSEAVCKLSVGNHILGIKYGSDEVICDIPIKGGAGGKSKSVASGLFQLDGCNVISEIYFQNYE
jgi:hypothetical protein